MTDSLLDRIAQFANRHSFALSIIGAAWLALSSAAHAHFIALPDIPFVTDRNAWIFAAIYNAGWWGFLRPAIERRRAAIEKVDVESARDD